MIFHQAERLKLQHSIHEKVRYLSSSLHFAAKVRGKKNLRDGGLSVDTVEGQSRLRVGRLRLEMFRQREIMLDEHMCDA